MRIRWDCEAVPLALRRPDEIQQAWATLLRNAFFAVGYKGQVILAIRNDAPWLLIDITDNGKGIDEALRARIFTPFFSTKNELKGMGLGLSICRRIVEDVGGSIDFKSVPEGDHLLGPLASLRIPAVSDFRGSLPLNGRRTLGARRISLLVPGRRQYVIPTMNIKDKVVIVTGASEGIGKALAEALSREGAKLVLAARSEDKLKALAAKLPGSIAVCVDMRNPEDVRAMVDAAMAAHGRVDILVNNAGQGMYVPVEGVDIERYKGVMELNVYAPLRAMQLVIPLMRKAGGGLIVNVSSMVSKNAYPNLGAYASTKYALNALSFTARAELAKDKIAVSVFHPRMTATRFGENAVGARPGYSGGSGSGAPPVDRPEQVAERIVELIGTEAAEANM